MHSHMHFSFHPDSECADMSLKLCIGFPHPTPPRRFCLMTLGYFCRYFNIFPLKQHEIITSAPLNSPKQVDEENKIAGYNDTPCNSAYKPDELATKISWWRPALTNSNSRCIFSSTPIVSSQGRAIPQQDFVKCLRVTVNICALVYCTRIQNNRTKCNRDKWKVLQLPKKSSNP